MGKQILLVRHCEAESQAVEAPLTKKGKRQAQQLKLFLKNHSIDRIISSPSTRAIQSTEPFAQDMSIQIETDERLLERVLSTKDMTNWMEKLRNSFDAMDLAYHGGESGTEATKRAMKVIEELWGDGNLATVIVTHGNLLALLIKHYQSSFGFDDWRRLSNPDMYRLAQHREEVSIQRLWEEIDS
ncbi:histidine phosphatase family protein [Virgibacillus halophilus]|uniref:histidine phosphatase family protein n=1 Tax=Tigheibacillus halophilus TaxID=361280 RepID=UPI0036F3854F